MRPGAGARGFTPLRTFQEHSVRYTWPEEGGSGRLETAYSPPDTNEGHVRQALRNRRRWQREAGLPADAAIVSRTVQVSVTAWQVSR
ncbi:MAG: hypothetical protein ACRDRJ_25720 [Streptosporangiaceae bacterium]